MRVFTYLVSQILGSIAFLMFAAWATFEPLYLRISLIVIGALTLSLSLKVLSDAVGKTTVREMIMG